MIADLHGVQQTFHEECLSEIHKFLHATLDAHCLILAKLLLLSILYSSSPRTKDPKDVANPIS